MADWATGNQAESALLITTSEITSLIAIVKAVNPGQAPGAMEDDGGNDGGFEQEDE
jgi:hypothetical protein